MGRAVGLVIGVLLGLHGLVGLFVEGDHLVELFNVDLLLDIVYLACAAALIGAALGARSPRVMRASLLAVGGVLLLLGVLGVLDNRLWGAAPTGFTGFDFLLFFAIGGACVVLALLPRTAAPLSTAGRPLTPGER